MDELEIDITVNDRSFKNVDVLRFKDIPKKENSNETIHSSNTLHVQFNEPVHLKILQVSAPDGQNLPDQIGIKLLSGKKEPFEVDGVPFTDVIYLTNGVFVLPDFRPVDNIYMKIVLSSKDSFELSPDFLGCLVPSKYK